MKNFVKTNKGITLIALVITIIVLLILAGVSIATLTGENGILTQADKAREQTEISGIREEAELIKTDLLIGEKTGQEKVTRSALAEAIQKQIGGTLKGIKVTTSDGKYDVYVKSNLDIVVEEHREETSGEEFEVQELSDGTIAVIKYNGTNPILNIPREIEVNGEYKTVTQIGSEDEDNIIGWEEPFLEQVILPDTLKKIEDWALARCFNEEAGAKIEVPDGVEFLGEAAFYGNGLVEITVPDTVTEVGEMVFDENKLKNIDISKGITQIPFAYASFNNITEVIIPNNITSIDDCAFYNNEIIKIYIPDTVKEIGERAFNANKITELNIPTSVKKIGVGAFASNCLEEEKAYIYNRNSNGIEDKSSLNSYAGNSTTAIIPTGIETIGENAFYSCTSLTSIEIPNSVTTIASSAFSSCTSLTSIEIPNSVTTIASMAFSSCTSLTSIEIPNSVTTIASSTFSSCTSLTNITLPSGITKIQYGAFQGCTALKNLYIPNTIESIDTYAFGSQYIRNYTTAIVNIDKEKDSITGAPWGLSSPGKVVWQDGEETAGHQY